MPYAATIALAKRMIAAKGEACVWSKPAPVDPSADEWRDVRAGSPAVFPVSIAWFTPKDLGRGRDEFLSALKGNSVDVPEGVEIGIMAATTFEPLASDTIVRTGGKVAHIVEIDRIAPDGSPILYFVKVKR